MTDLEISFRWIPIQGLANAPYSFPQAVSLSLRKQYERPGIYRWRVEREGRVSVYIGETENIVRRLTQYLKPGSTQITNRRLRDRLDYELHSGARISFDILLFDPFSINGYLYSTADLGSQEIRCFIENLLLSQLPRGTERLNRLDSLEQKIVTGAALTLNPMMRSDDAKALASGILTELKQKAEQNSLK